MMKRVKSVLLVLACLLPSYLSAQSADTITIDTTLSAALQWVEEHTGVSIVYSTSQVKEDSLVYLRSSGLTPCQIVQRLVGPNYVATSYGDIVSVRYLPLPKQDIVYLDVPSKECETLQNVSTKKKLHDLSKHKLQMNLALGEGIISYETGLAFVFSVDYIYYFHKYWGFSVGLGNNVYGASAKGDKERIVTFSTPMAVQLSYHVLRKMRLIASAGTSLELPIDGVYCTDEMGERYANSLLYGLLVDIGIAMPVGDYISIGAKLYGQTMFASSGDVYNEMHGAGVGPFQFGLRFYFQVDKWTKPMHISTKSLLRTR